MGMNVFTSKEYIGDGKTVGLHRRVVAESQALHSHDFIEIVYIAEGKALEWIDDEPYEAEKGDVFLIHCGSTHAFTTESGFTCYEIFFSPDLVSSGTITAENALSLLAFSLFSDLRKEQSGVKLTMPQEERKEVEHILSAMHKEYGTNADDAHTVIENYLNILLTKMRRVVRAADGGFISDAWESLRRYIDEHPEENLSLSVLAGKSFYNASYFSRVFKQKFGRSPIEYVRARRIERAMELLRESDDPIEKIMAKIGFSDRSSFYHAFSAQSGMTPAEYRASCEKK